MLNNLTVLKEVAFVSSIEALLLERIKTFHGIDDDITLFIESIEVPFEEPTAQLIFEELTDSEQYDADRMKGSGHSYYSDVFLSKHPKAKEAFDRARSDGERSGRIRIPVDIHPDNIKPSERVTSHLSLHGYSTTPEMYSKGLAHKEVVVGDPERGIPFQKKLVQKRIGAVLKETGASQEITDHYANDPVRQSATNHQYDIIFSNNNRDLYGMSTGRSWVSCGTMRKNCETFNGNGPAAKKMKDEINNHTHVAYLVPRGGDVDKEAIGRLLFKHHTSIESGHETLFPESHVYGSPPANFAKIADSVVSSLYTRKPELYAKNSNVYNDDGKQFRFPEGRVSPEHVDSMYAHVKSNVKKSDTRKKYYLGQVMSSVVAGEKYKSTDLNRLSKQLKLVSEHNNEGNFIGAAKAISDIHDSVDKDMHHGLSFGTSNSQLPDLISSTAKLFDAKNPEHLKYISGIQYSESGQIRHDLRSEVVRNVTAKEVRTPEEFADAAALHSAFSMTSASTPIKIASDHKFGSNAIEKTSRLLGERGILTMDNFHRVYSSLRNHNRARGNFYDHAVRLERSDVPGASELIGEIGKKFREQINDRYSSRGEESAAGALHYSKPETRERLADAIGIADHKEFVKPYVNTFRERDRKLKELMAQAEENKKANPDAP